MKNYSIITKVTAIFLAGSVLLASCESMTMIQSNPSGAKLYLNDESVGTTPYNYHDTKIVGSLTGIRLEKDGYETLNTSLSRNEQVDVGAIVAGLFLLFPFLWTMQYKPVHSYDLVPLDDKGKPENVMQKQQKNAKSKADRLRELKQLLDDKVITQEEFDKEKKKILDE
ncbi:MAG: PEGA domain-containing protein [Bacteroidia bacterium]|nr:PEGA domain-containing protein [Bacteroidia bacterium]